MTPRWSLVLTAFLGACTSAKDLCFEEATRDYRAALDLIAQAEAGAEHGYMPTPERLDFIDVAECGPTLEDRKICTTQSSASLPGYTHVDRETAARFAAEQRARLGGLRKEAEAAYRVCLVNARGA